LFFTLNQSWAGELRVSSNKTETVKTLSFLSVQNNCDVQENWDCRTKVVNRSGTIDISRCRGTKSIACYEDIKETCYERSSGKESTRSYQQFTGVCANSYGACW
jgi:hypothetical protein